MDIRQSEHYAQYMKAIGWQVEKAGGHGQGTNVFVRHFPIFKRWSVIKVQRPGSFELKTLDEIAKKHRALFAKIEPDTNSKLPVLDSQFTKDSWPLLPSKTLILDTSPPIAGLYERLPKDTRYEVRQAMKRRVEISESSDIELFYKLLQETMKIGKWSVPIHKEVVALWKSFQPKQSQILIAYHNQKPIGGCLLIWQGEQAHYMYAALTVRGRNLGASYLTLFEAIKFLKKRGTKKLDLEGIYDERFKSQTKNWLGFTKFKFGWGGSIVEYEGSFSRFYNPFIKILFSLPFAR